MIDLEFFPFLKEDVKPAPLPAKGTHRSIGYDLVATEIKYNSLDIGSVVIYKLGLGVKLPETDQDLRLHADLCPRSSISKYPLALCNGIGKIDNDFRGEMQARFFITKNGVHLADLYKVGDKVAQLCMTVEPLTEPKWAEEVDVTDRGEGGFGSTDSK